ncbi:thioredoxin reductase (NADPH) [Pancytospora philotis]|nr:thioredoxin reductase (NADPH) [Pancytospora philotis]
MATENVIVIGSGPAAYSAALYCIDLKPLLFEGEYTESAQPGGQLMTTTDVDNYPGFPGGTTGPGLMDDMRAQALEEGVRIISNDVVSVKKEDGVFVVKDAGEVYRARAVIVATGAAAKRLYEPGTRDGEFWQKGISACAVCDGYIFKNKTVAVIGGGDTAMEEALYMSNIASRVHLLHRRNEFRAREDKLCKVRNTANIEVITPAELVSAHGDTKLENIKVIDKEAGKTFDIAVDGLFFAIGHVPNVKFLDGMVELSGGYIKTDGSGRTSVEGMFACGDVQDYYYRQAITAAASGCVAADQCVKYLSS